MALAQDQAADVGQGWMDGWLDRLAGDCLGLSAPVWLDCVFSRYNYQFAVCGWLGKWRDAQCTVSNVDFPVVVYLPKLTGNFVALCCSLMLVK